MKHDKLEHFIRDFASEINEDLDVDKSWQNLKPKLDAHKRRRLYKSYSIAASLFLLMASGILLFNLKTENQNSTSNVAEYSEAEQAQMQYATLIEIKRNEINSFRDKEPELCKEFETQLTELDQMYNELVPQMDDVNKKEIVLQAMIENLQMQLDILSKQLEIVQQVNEKKNEKSRTLEL